MDELIKAELARLRDEDNRQNHRIDDLEQSVKAIQDLTISVHALAQDMRQMLSELKDQGHGWSGLTAVWKPWSRNQQRDGSGCRTRSWTRPWGSWPVL